MTYPTWVFDSSPIDDPFGYGERAVRFIRALKHPASGRPFQLDRWQERIVRRIYGPRNPDHTRIVRNVVMLVSRGARKTTLGAALALLHTIGPERVPRGQAVLAAYDRDQARIAFEESDGICVSDPKIVAATRRVNTTHRITHRRSGAFLRAVSADAAASNGQTPRFVLYDELHCWKKRDLYDVLRTGLSKSPNTLSIVISQAGRGSTGVASEVFDYARRVSRGDISDDPGTLPILFETDPDVDWRDESHWHKANPGLALGYPDIGSLRQMAREAEHRPAVRAKFLNDHLGIWLDTDGHDPFVDMTTYDSGSAPFDLDELEGSPCWLAVDLSKTHDLTAIVAVWRRDDGSYVTRPWFFCPKEELRARADRDGVPYMQWQAEGFLTATPGNVVDYGAVEWKVRELCERFTPREIVFDRWEASGIMRALNEDGLPIFGHGQGFRDMAGSINELERAIIDRKLQHGGHPILRWNIENVAITSDDAGNRKFTKAKAKELIDGAVALAMAIGRAHADEDPGSIYNDEAARPHGLLFF